MYPCSAVSFFSQRICVYWVFGRQHGRGGCKVQPGVGAWPEFEWLGARKAEASLTPPPAFCSNRVCVCVCTCVVTISLTFWSTHHAECYCIPFRFQFIICLLVFLFFSCARSTVIANRQCRPSPVLFEFFICSLSTHPYIYTCMRIMISLILIQY